MPPKTKPEKVKPEKEEAVYIQPGVLKISDETLRMQDRFIRESGPYLRQAMLNSADGLEGTGRAEFLNEFHELFFLQWPELPAYENEHVDFITHRKKLIKKRIALEFVFSSAVRAVPEEHWRDFIVRKTEEYHKKKEEKAELQRQMEILTQISKKRKLEALDLEANSSRGRPRPRPKPKPKPVNRRLSLHEIRKPDEDLLNEELGSLADSAKKATSD
ncbi:hypothetical protein CPC08DRAFT_765696 [Agrocybe pediades]|nr:hypothetical protein CPC08DRAFT_765696 [Agrocybe pediades]